MPAPQMTQLKFFQAIFKAELYSVKPHTNNFIYSKYFKLSTIVWAKLETAI